MGNLKFIVVILFCLVVAAYLHKSDKGQNKKKRDVTPIHQDTLYPFYLFGKVTKGEGLKVGQTKYLAVLQAGEGSHTYRRDTIEFVLPDSTPNSEVMFIVGSFYKKWVQS